MPTFRAGRLHRAQDLHELKRKRFEKHLDPTIDQAPWLGAHQRFLAKVSATVGTVAIATLPAVFNLCFHGLMYCCLLHSLSQELQNIRLVYA